jgi:hypothetical protein
MKTLIVCHDAGASEVVASWARRQNLANFDFLLQGPSQKVFERRLGQNFNKVTESEVSKRQSNYQRMVTGTSWSSDLEKKWLVWAKEHHIHSETFLDHWVNYKERFEWQGFMILPDVLYVYDEMAKERAEKELGHCNVQIIPNPHWEDCMNEIKILEQGLVSDTARLHKNPQLRVLYVTQPIEAVAKKLTGSKRGYGYTEFEALDKFVDWIQKTQTPVDEIKLRLHPSEAQCKYNEWIDLNRDKVPLSLSHSENLLVDIAWADVVVGCDTMAMVIAHHAHRRVLSTIPSGGRPLEIPIQEIERLFA